MAILANSRPFEGLVASVPAMMVVGVAGPQEWVPTLLLFWRVVLPIVIVLVVTAGTMGFYNVRMTGDPLRFPYLLHEETYSIAPLFFLQKPRPQKIYNHEIIGAFHTDWELTPYLRQQSASGLLEETGKKVAHAMGFLSWNRANDSLGCDVALCVEKQADAISTGNMWLIDNDAAFGELGVSALWCADHRSSLVISRASHTAFAALVLEGEAHRSTFGLCDPVYPSRIVIAILCVTDQISQLRLEPSESTNHDPVEPSRGTPSCDREVREGWPGLFSQPS